MLIDRYRDTDAPTWNALVQSSHNGTFQFEREYMDYHRDRFADHSLLVRDTEGKLLAILPAHLQGGAIASHDGLSFGGMIVGACMKAPLFLHAFEAVLLNLQQLGFAALHYKCTPHIYHRQPAEDDRYALLLGAQLTRRDLLSVVYRDDRLPFQWRRLRGIKKATTAGVAIRQEIDFTEYWSLLSETLAIRHGAEPVHSLAEIQLLRERFAHNIRLHTARSSSGELLAGVVLYLSDRVAHAQYIASSKSGRDVGALDLLFDRLIGDTSHDASFFDFGSSHEDAGRIVNEGLIDQKEGFGARSVTFDRYRIDLTTIHPGILTGALR